MVPLAKRQTVCVGIMSYDGGVNFGLIGDYEAMPMLDHLAEALEHSLAELSATAPQPRGAGPRARGGAGYPGSERWSERVTPGGSSKPSSALRSSSRPAS